MSLLLINPEYLKRDWADRKVNGSLDERFKEIIQKSKIGLVKKCLKSISREHYDHIANMYLEHIVNSIQIQDAEHEIRDNYRMCEELEELKGILKNDALVKAKFIFKGKRQAVSVKSVSLISDLIKLLNRLHKEGCNPSETIFCRLPRGRSTNYTRDLSAFELNNFLKKNTKLTREERLIGIYKFFSVTPTPILKRKNTTYGEDEVNIETVDRVINNGRRKHKNIEKEDRERRLKAEEYERANIERSKIGKIGKISI